MPQAGYGPWHSVVLNVCWSLTFPFTRLPTACVSCRWTNWKPCQSTRTYVKSQNAITTTRWRQRRCHPSLTNNSVSEFRLSQTFCSHQQISSGIQKQREGTQSRRNAAIACETSENVGVSRISKESNCFVCQPSADATCALMMTQHLFFKSRMERK